MAIWEFKKSKFSNSFLEKKEKKRKKKYKFIQ